MTTSNDASEAAEANTSAETVTKTNDEPTTEVSEPKVDIHGDIVETKPELKPAVATGDPEKEPGADKTETTEAGSKDQTFGDFLKEKAPLVIEKTVKHPKIEESDISVIDGKQVIKSQHVYDKTLEVFGGENAAGKQVQPNLNAFHNINNNDRKSADRLAKLWGFKNRHQLAGLIDEYQEATDTASKNSVLEQFPDWIKHSDVQPPFSAEIGKAVQKQTTEDTWSRQDISRAISDYAADNNVDKKGLLASAKLFKVMTQYKGLEKGGKPISPSEAIKLAAPLLKSEDLKHEDTVSLGGGRATQFAPTTNKTSTQETEDKYMKSLPKHIKALQEKEQN